MEPIFASIITGIVITVVGGIVVAFLKRKWSKCDHNKLDEEKKITEQYQAVKSMEKSIWRLNKTVLIMAKIIDDQTTKNHPDLTSSLEDIATELLKETDNS